MLYLIYVICSIYVHVVSQFMLNIACCSVVITVYHNVYVHIEYTYSICLLILSDLWNELRTIRSIVRHLLFCSI